MTLAARCHSGGRCFSSAYSGSSRSRRCLKWRSLSTDGLERGEKCCQAHETFLRTTARSFTITARQAFTVIRVNSLALCQTSDALLFLALSALLENTRERRKDQWAVTSPRGVITCISSYLTLCRRFGAELLCLGLSACIPSIKCFR